MLKTAMLIILVAAMLFAATPASARIPTNVVIAKVRVQVRMDKPHSLGLCWPNPIKHLHVEVFKIEGGRGTYLSNFHVGKSGSCYVVFNNYKPSMCYKTCNGEKGLRGSLVKAAKTIALALGVTFTAAAILAIVTAAVAPAVAIP
jgi:hypothetical protein